MLFIQVVMLTGTFLMITGFVGDAHEQAPTDFHHDPDA